MDIVSRKRWGAKYDAGSGTVNLPVEEVWCHHTVTLAPDLAFNDLNKDSTDDDEVKAMQQIESIGQQRFKQGYSYTFAVMPSGRVYEGTGAGRLGSHTQYRNSRSHGLVAVGNYEENEPSNLMLRGFADLLRHGKTVGWWKNAKFNGGHRDLKQTVCPGIKLYRKIPDINRMAAEPLVIDKLPPKEDLDMYMFTNADDGTTVVLIPEIGPRSIHDPKRDIDGLKASGLIKGHATVSAIMFARIIRGHRIYAVE